MLTQFSVLLVCVVLGWFPVRRTTINRPQVGSSLTLTCTPPTSFPHAIIYWAFLTSDNRIIPVNYTDRVTIDPVGKLTGYIQLSDVM